jgi:DNA-binding YbaB/EbfC family protein
MAKGFGGFPGGNIQGMLQQAQKMQKDMEKVQAELETLEVEGTAGGKAVTFVINGKYEVLKVEIQPEAIDPNDREMLQDMVRAAANDAITKIKELTKSKMSKVTGGMNLPGMP